MVAGDRHLVGEVAEPVQREDLGQPTEGLAEQRHQPGPGTANCRQRADGDIALTGQLDTYHAFRRARRVGRLNLLTAALLHDLAPVDRGDRDRQVVAVTEHKEGELTSRVRVHEGDEGVQIRVLVSVDGDDGVSRSEPGDAAPDSGPSRTA